MIDKFFIETALDIRRRYFELNDESERYASILKRLVDDLMKVHNSLEDIASKESKVNEYTNSDLIKLANDYSEEITKLETAIKINTEERNSFEQKLKDLGDESEILFKNIRSKYSNITDEEIANAILEYDIN